MEVAVKVLVSLSVIVLLSWGVYSVAVSLKKMNRCPRCNRRTMKRTGKKRSENGEPEEQWRCKVCGHNEWRSSSSGVGGAGGPM